MIEKLRQLNEEMLINDANNEKYLLIKEILSNRNFIWNTDIEVVYSIFSDLKIEEKDFKNIYNKLMEESNEKNN